MLRIFLIICALSATFATEAQPSAEPRQGELVNIVDDILAPLEIQYDENTTKEDIMDALRKLEEPHYKFLKDNFKHLLPIKSSSYSVLNVIRVVVKMLPTDALDFLTAAAPILFSGVELKQDNSQIKLLVPSLKFPHPIVSYFYKSSLLYTKKTLLPLIIVLMMLLPKT